MAITVVFDPPLPSDAPAAFNTKAFSTLGDLNAWSTQANAVASDVNLYTTIAQSSALSATTARDTAIAEASNANASATNAASSASAAATSASNAAASFDAFDDRYLGAKASDPALDNDGNALLTGALYWNTSSNVMRVYSGSAWFSVSAASGDVTGPASTTDNTIARFDGATGKLLQGSSVVVDDNGNLILTAGALGYGTGAGGTITQPTNKATAITLNKPSGQVTMNSAALVAGATVSFSFNNSFCASTVDQLAVAMFQTVAGANYNIWAVNNGIGQFVVFVKNISAGSLSEAVVINFAVIKGAAS